MKYHREFHRHWEHEPLLELVQFTIMLSFGIVRLETLILLIVRWYEFTDVLLRNLRDKFTDVNFIGIRVLEPRDANGFIRRYTGWNTPAFDKTQKIWKKNVHLQFANLDIILTLDFLVLHCPAILNLMLMMVLAKQKSNLLLLRV